MAEVIAWPFPLYSGEAGLNLESFSRTPGRTLSGFSPVVGTAVQLWSFRMNMNNLNPNIVRQYRAAIASGRGEEVRFRIQVRDDYAPSPTAEGLPGRISVFHRRGAPFSTGAGYRHRGIEIPLNINRGARSVAVPDQALPFLTRGVYFGLGSDLHIVSSVIGNRMEFEPAARRSHVDELLNLRPHLIARFTDRETGQALFRDNRFSAPSVSFVEAPL